MGSRLCPFCMQMADSETCPHCGNNTNYAGSPAHLPAGYVVSGGHPYVLGAALGQGGFGITYIALDMETRERVAIKEYFPTYCSTRADTSTVSAYSKQEEVYQKGKERFLDEARTLKSLSDLKNIVNVLDFFEANNTAYLVMEYLDGDSLKEHAAKYGKFPAQQFLKQIRPLMEDIHRMHERGVIHRDIAPDNIILLPDGQMKLIDFGAARSYVGDKSMTVVVKKGFAPVEQYMSKGSSASTDVYALAATIYYCITGKVPPDSAERQYDDVPLASPSSLGTAITPEQEKALLQALEVQQKSRTQSIQELLDTICGKISVFPISETKLDSQSHIPNGREVITLDAYVRKRGRLPAQEFLKQFQPLMQDVERLHQRGIVHRNICPKNILVLPDGRMKLVDYDTACASGIICDSDLRLTSGFSPYELYLTKEPLTPSTDVYALAATIYYCITGKAPLTPTERLFEDVPPVSPVSLGIDITPEQEKALLQALEIQQKNRTQSVQILLEQLCPEKSPPGPAPGPGPRPPKKKWWIGIAAIAAALALCLGFFLFSQKDEAPATQAESKPAMQVSATEPAVPTALPEESPVIDEPMTEEERTAAAEAEIRYALSLLLDRSYICNEIGAAGQVPASSFVPMGMTDPDGSQFYENAGHSDAYNGYIDVSEGAFEENFAKGYNILRKYYDVDSDGMFTNFPELTYLYNTSSGHQAIGEYIQSALASVGITVTLESQEWNTFLQNRKQGDFTIARNGWLADYNDPITFLDMWISSSGNNDVQFGRGNHKNLAVYDLDLTDLGYDIQVKNGTWAETYDVLIGIIKSCRDQDTRYALMHRAEDLLMSTGAIVPLYFYTDTYLSDSGVDGVLVTPLGLKNFSKATVNGSGNSIAVHLGAIPKTMDPALNSSQDVMSLLSHLFAGLAKWSTDENGNCVIVPDCAVELPEGTLNPDGTVTYTYTLKDNMQWTNGESVTAADFEYAWKRAASIELSADYGYMFDVIKGYPDNLAVKAVDSHTLRVTLNSDVPYWNELLAFPTYFPVHEGSVKNGWLDHTPTMLSNGAYSVSSFSTIPSDSKNHITLRKNDTYHDADEVTMEEIEFYLSDDATKMYNAFKSGILQFADDPPYGTMGGFEDLHVTGIMGTYYACWNINETLLPVS